LSDNLQPILKRSEYKYLIPNDLVSPLRLAVGAVCRLDRHACSNGLYSIRSLYLDTANLDLYWANEHEKKERFKVRIRCYPETDAPVFLEVKTRSGDAITKTRVGVRPDHWKDVVESSNGLDQEGLQPALRRQAERFLSLVHTYHLEPTVLVEYEREAYVSTIDYYARVTFDRNIAGQEKKHLDLSAHTDQWRPIDHPVRTTTTEPVWVLELKFERSAPIWMSALVQRFELNRFAFSKYCYSLGELSSLPGPRASTQRKTGEWLC